MALPPSIKKPLDQGIRFRNEESAETPTVVFTPEITLDLDPNRQIRQPPAYDGLLSRRGRVPASILIDPRLYPFAGEPPDDYFFQIDSRTSWRTFSRPTGNLASYLGISGANAVSIWTFEEANGIYLDKVAGNHLTATLGTLSDRNVVGLWNGTDYTSFKSCEFPSQLNGVGATASNANALDASDSVSLIAVFRTAMDSSTDNGGIGKYDPTAGGNNGAGYGFHFTFNNAIVTEVAGGNGIVGGKFTRTLANNCAADGAIHYLVMTFSRASSSLASYMDTSKVAPTTSASIGTLTSSPAVFTVGRQYNAFQTGHWQPIWVAVLTGSAAEVMFWASGAMDSWWATVVNKAPPGTTYEKLGASANIMGYVPGTGSIVGAFGTNEVEFAYHNRLSGPNKVGMVLRGFQIQNQLGNSAYVTGNLWTITGSTLIPRAGDCPRGFRNASLVHKTNVSGNVRIDITPGTSNYCSVAVKRTGSAQPVIRVVQTSDNSLIAQQTCTSSLEGEWGIYKVTFGSAGASRIELHPSNPNDTSGSAFFQYAAHYVQAGLLTSSQELLLPQPAFGGANINGAVISCYTTGNVIFDSFGEVDTTVMPLANFTSNRNIWDNNLTGSDARILYLSQSNGNLVTEVRTTSPSASIVPNSLNFGASPGFEATVKLAWNSTGSYTLGYTITSSAGSTSSFGLSGSTALTASAGTARILDLGSGSSPPSILPLIKVYAKTKIM